VRQKLPESHGYALLVNDIGRTVSPGEEFDCPLLVPGCVPVEDSAGEDTAGADSTAEPPKPRAKGTRP
jgi:hypothetical protein